MTTPATLPTTHVQGYCPMGCGGTLTLGAGGYITCGHLGCPRPDAVTTILAVRESEHVVDFGGTGFTILHPLRERLDDALLHCELHAYCQDLDGPPVKPGKYRATWSPSHSRWVWTAMP